MDYSPIVAQVWGMLTWFIPAALLIGLLKSPWAKGQIGELLVRLFAHWQLDRQTYRRLHNVTLNTPDGTTQIDHVFLSPYGIFVLETVSVILQVASFKLTGKRLFRMAPIHHHYELKGWPEPRVIVRFWITTVMLVLFGLATLKLR